MCLGSHVFRLEARETGTYNKHGNDVCIRCFQGNTAHAGLGRQEVIWILAPVPRALHTFLYMLVCTYLRGRPQDYCMVWAGGEVRFGLEAFVWREEPQGGCHRKTGGG
jgi:hypothetical protein